MPSNAINAEANHGVLSQLIDDGSGRDRIDLPPIVTWLTDLRLWSDVIWIVWEKQVDIHNTELEHLSRYTVIVEDTKLIMDGAAGVVLSQFEVRWLGKKLLGGCWFSSITRDRAREGCGVTDHGLPNVAAKEY